MEYKLTCFSGIDAYKFAFDISRDNIPEKYCVGKNGFDKNLSLEQVINFIAKPKNANFIVKPGANAKWYVKKVDFTLKNQQYFKNKNTKCYVIEW